MRFNSDAWLSRLSVLREKHDVLLLLQQANIEANKRLRDNDEPIFLKAIDIACTQARDDALEEAARLVEDMPIAMALGVAAAIRALKDKP